MSDDQIRELIKVGLIFLQPEFLRSMETSQLVVILKLYKFLGIIQRIELDIINAITDEIDSRITPEGIKQFRDGFVTSESSYYVLFLSYMLNNLDKIKDYDILDNIISKIYQNLEILQFSSDMNHDLVSELFYSCESLKLLNCIETIQMKTCLARYLFPSEIVDKIREEDDINRSNARFRHHKVSRITGETIN